LTPPRTADLIALAEDLDPIALVEDPARNSHAALKPHPSRHHHISGPDRPMKVAL
jgi:hypothetical protein